MTTLVIDHDPPPGANKLLRMHWAERNDLAETWGWLVKQAWMEASRPTYDRATVTYRLYYRVRRKRDWDGCVTACKHIQDALVAIGCIPDDNPDIIQSAVVVGIDADHPRVIIEIEPLDLPRTDAENSTISSSTNEGFGGAANTPKRGQ